MMSKLIAVKLQGLLQHGMSQGGKLFPLVKIRAQADKLVNKASVNKPVNSASAGALAP